MTIVSTGLGNELDTPGAPQAVLDRTPVGTTKRESVLAAVGETSHPEAARGNQRQTNRPQPAAAK